jgi:hypothetical protein
MITGRAGSALKVNCRMELVVKGPSVTVRVTAELPSAAGIPEIRPLTVSMLNPEGRPLALTLAAGVPPVVYTWKRNGCPTLPVTLVLLAITGPEAGAGCTVSMSGAVVVPPEFIALSSTWNVPAALGVPMTALRVVSKVSPEGRLVTASEVAPLASN